MFISNTNNFSKYIKPGMQFHDRKNRQELKYVSKKSKGYVFLPTIHIEPLLSRNEETVTTMNCYFYYLIAYKKLTPAI